MFTPLFGNEIYRGFIGRDNLTDLGRLTCLWLKQGSLRQPDLIMLGRGLLFAAHPSLIFSPEAMGWPWLSGI